MPGGILTWFLMWQPVLSWAAILTLGHASIGTAPGLGAPFLCRDSFSKYFPLHKGITNETSYVEIQL